MILLCTFKSLIKIVEPKNTEFLCGKVVSGKSVLYNWRRREKSTVIHEPCTINFLEKILQRFFFSESIIDFTDFIWFILLGLFCRYYCYLWPEVGVRMFCKVFFRSCIIVFSAIMDKTRNFLHCSAKTLYALNVGDSYWTIQRHNLESIHCDDRTSALSLDRKKAPSDDRSKQARLSVYSLKSVHFIKEFYWGNTIQSCPWPRSDPCHHWRSPRFFFPLP